MVNYIGDRISHSKKGNELVLVISSKIEKWQETLLFTWIIAWLLCGVYIVYSLFNDGYTKELNLILFVYLIFWGYYAYMIGYVFLFRKYGDELILMTPTTLQIKQDIKGYGKVNSYLIENIKELEIVELAANSFATSFGSSFWTITQKAISFRYFGKLIAFGIQLNEKESKQVLKIIKSKLK